MPDLNFAVVLGSVRNARMAARVGRYLVAKCKERGHHTSLVDPAELAFPMLDRMFKEFTHGEAPEPIAGVAETFRAADAYIIVSAEYNHSIPPALSNLLDHYLEEYFFKPSGIVCYSPGAFGGIRAAMQLRAMLPEMGMPSIPTILPFPKVHEALDPDGRPTEASKAKVERSTEKFLDELVWYARALKAARAAGTPY